MNERIGPVSTPSALSRVALGAAERIGFWGSVLLPATYFPVLYGLDGTTKLFVLTALVTLNVVCLHLGRQYRT
ncbi:hypothetical protein [Halovenus sp. HT40]|uniref:hypothetical protein n=1 Tax=Halovenus sp. HT40 TaxID=3126691 RepID=UPI00300EAF9B